VKINIDDPSSSSGLTDQQVIFHREKYGANILLPPKQPSEIIKIMKLFLSLFNILL
jgi:hypothetical protein